tara:strand:- start:8 stop:574 length:567 start_codon:yes stop_codon:yes gene_type:complete
MNKPLILTSPKGVAEFPYLTEPDVVFNPEGLFHTKLVCKKSDCVNIIKDIDDMIALEVKKQHDLNPKKQVTKAPLPYSIENEEVTFNFKLKAQGVRKSDGKTFTQAPNLLNADLSEFEKKQTIWGGSILKITFSPYAWNMPIGIGCTLRLKSVQVLELVTGKSSNTLGELKAEPIVAPKVKEQPPEVC